jgi:3-phenylpropionate/cinnamic acid dioxygenase small subunit
VGADQEIIMDVADRLAIHELFARYSHTYDDGHLDRLGSLFTDDATFEIRGSIGAMPTVMAGREEIVATMTRRYRETRPAQRRHLISNVMVEDIDGDTAHAAAYLLLGSTVDDTLALPVTGRYSNEYRRVDGAWLIHHQVLTLDAALG